MPKYICRSAKIEHNGGEIVILRGQEVDPGPFSQAQIQEWLQRGTIQEVEEPKPVSKPEPSHLSPSSKKSRG